MALQVVGVKGGIGTITPHVSSSLEITVPVLSDFFDESKVSSLPGLIFIFPTSGVDNVQRCVLRDVFYGRLLRRHLLLPHWRH